MKFMPDISDGEMRIWSMVASFGASMRNMNSNVSPTLAFGFVAEAEVDTFMLGAFAPLIASPPPTP